MWTNTLKIAFKHFVTHRLYTLINVAGLGIGLACCLVISLFVLHELTYERQFRDADRLALVYQDIEGYQGSFQGNSAMPAGPLLEQDFPQVEASARIANLQSVVGNGEILNTEQLQFADPAFLTLFDFTWMAGDPLTALADPNAIVLTRSMAEKYFGREDALGQALTLQGRFDVHVTGIIEDLPTNTHLQIHAIVPMDRMFILNPQFDGNEENWGFMFFSTYVLLRQAADLDAVREGLPDFAQRHTLGEDGLPRILGIMPITDLYLKADLRSGNNALGNLARVKIFATIALSILVIAVINFMNLSTARASWRAMEVGLRFTVGAGRLQVMRQFLTEALIMVFCAMLLATLITELCLPLVNNLLVLNLSLGMLTGPASLALLAALTAVLGLVAGSYPAFYLTAFRPARVLKGELTHGNAGTALRSLLVIFQFAISITLIVVSAGVIQQMQFINQFDTGFEREGMISLALPESPVFNVNTQWNGFRNRLLENPNILAATHSLSTPLQEGRMGVNLMRDGDTEPRGGTIFLMSPDYLQTYDIDLLAGRYYGGESDIARILPGDPDNPKAVAGGMILNATAAAELGWTPEQAIGEVLRIGFFGSTFASQVIGVVEDTVSSAREAPGSLVYVAPDTFNYGFLRGRVSLQVSGNDMTSTLDHIDRVWTEFIPGEPVSPQFLEAQFNARYQQETLQMKLFTVAALVGVLVACFGLYGLATFNTERRTKEIGIRKVLGGSVWSIVLLLTSDFSKLVLVANLLAWPVGWFALNLWLEGFVYRIDLTPLIFIGSGLIALCIAWVTVGGTAAKAASQRPVRALRYE